MNLKGTRFENSRLGMEIFVKNRIIESIIISFKREISNGLICRIVEISMKENMQMAGEMACSLNPNFDNEEDLDEFILCGMGFIYEYIGLDTLNIRDDYFNMISNLRSCVDEICSNEQQICLIHYNIAGVLRHIKDTRSEFGISLIKNEMFVFVLKKIIIYYNVDFIESTVHIDNCIKSEKAGGNGLRFKNEAEATKFISNNISLIFEDIQFVKNEYALTDGSRVDLLCKNIKTGKDVIIEVKYANTSPNKQLVYYNHMLGGDCEMISITQYDVKTKIDNIKYYTFDDFMYKYNNITIDK